MSERRRINFTKPPVQELALSVQFEPLEGLTASRLGQIHAHFKDRFPNTEDQQPLARAIEVFGGRTPPLIPKLDIQVLAGAPAPTVRSWFLTKDGRELVQVQPDRFVRNWRKLDDTGKYPSFASVLSSFEADFQKLEAALLEQRLPPIRVDQCEVTYVDHMIAQEGWQEHHEVDHVFSTWSWPGEVTGLRPEQVAFNMSYVLEGDERQPAGRVHVNVRPAHRMTDGVPVFVMQSTARGRPMGTGIPGSVAFMRRANRVLVDLFVAITKERMHGFWGREDHA